MAYKRRLRFDKRIRFRKSMSIMYILLFVVLASIGTGYAYIKSDLKINGTANVMKANWNVHFENLNVTSGSVTATTPASITNDTTVTFAAELTEPNDFYEFTVDVTNDGTMDAMIDSFSISPTLTTAQAKYLEYTITYSDDEELVNKQELNAGDTETLKVRFSYIENSDKTNYPTADQNFNIVFSVDYTQTDGTEIPVDHPQIVYTSQIYADLVPGHNWMYIGQAIPSSVTQYSTGAAALAAFQNDTGNTSASYYFKHKVKNGIVTESYVEFVITPEMANTYSGITAGTYSLRGARIKDDNNVCLSEYYDSTTGKCVFPYYEENRDTIVSACGSRANVDTGNYPYTSCSIGTAIYNYANGRVSASSNQWSCSVDNSGLSICVYD